jgi:hypothetical protein
VFLAYKNMAICFLGFTRKSFVRYFIAVNNIFCIPKFLNLTFCLKSHLRRPRVLLDNKIFPQFFRENAVIQSFPRFFRGFPRSFPRFFSTVFRGYPRFFRIFSAATRTLRVFFPYKNWKCFFPLQALACITSQVNLTIFLAELFFMNT